MGVKLSNMISSYEYEQESCHREIYSPYENCEDFSIPDDLLVDVLSFVPSQDLLLHCRLVSKQWKDIIDGHSVWKIKCERERKTIPPFKLQNLPLHYYRLIYLFNPYGKNLVRNPCGEDGLIHWIVTSNGGDGFIVENPPVGADAVPAEVGVQHCFATSYFACAKHQIIDLVAEGIQVDVIDSGNMKIKIGEWHAARFDCASEYRLAVHLLDETFKDEQIFENGVTIDSFEFTHKEDQWIGKEWNLVTHTFDNVTKTRYVLFEHSGADSQFWAGHFGSKMTGSFVYIIF